MKVRRTHFRDSFAVDTSVVALAIQVVGLRSCTTSIFDQLRGTGSFQPTLGPRSWVLSQHPVDGPQHRVLLTATLVSKKVNPKIKILYLITVTISYQEIV